MRALVQRCSSAAVSTEGRRLAEIGPGLLVLLGIAPEDTDADADRLADKVRALRIFPDADGRMNEPLGDREVLCVSQFTLYGDARRGNRPSFVAAAPPDHAEPLYERFCERLEASRGVFGAMMAVGLAKDGPVTLLDAALGALAAVLVAVRMGQLGGSRREVVFGGLLAAFLPSMVIASTSVMSEALFVPLLLGVISCAVAFRAGGKGGWLAACGLLLAGATPTRPIGAVLAFAAALLAFRSWPRAQRLVLAAAAGALLAIVPCVVWELRDIRALHH